MGKALYAILCRDNKTRPPPVSMLARLLRFPATVCMSLTLFLQIAAQPIPSIAADNDAPCPESPQHPFRANLTPKRAPVDREPTYVSAQQIQSLRTGISELTGEVELMRGDQRIYADHVVYDETTDTAEAEDRVTLKNDAGDSYQTGKLHLQLGSRIGYAAASAYTLAEGRARGGAERIEFLGRDRTRLTNARYTTCRIGQDDWFLKARDLELDHAEEVGTARGTSVRFFRVPIFYFPYLTFPISDRRRSGFLTPQFGRSDESGTAVATPYYFNLAPNYDDTLTPRILSRRGIQLQNEFRYLGHQSLGRLDVEFLPKDDVTGDDRSAWKIVHTNAFTPRWSASIDARRVSDDNYLNDFGDHLAITSQSVLRQTGEIRYRGPVWNFATRASNFQTVDPTITTANQPYARLPQLLLWVNPPGVANRPAYHFESELTNFDRDGSITGTRLTLDPAVSIPFRGSYGFVIPKVGAHYASYNLSGSVTGNRRPSLGLGSFSLDNGLYFERTTSFGARRYVQTLEPRLFYLYVPYKNQDDLPKFDTSIPDFSFLNLFRENRFVGGDRIGDANQVTLGLTSRFVDEADGIERLRASIGEIYYLADRRVNIPAGAIAGNTSDIAAELTAWLLGNWHARAGVQWNRDQHRSQKGNLFLQYNPARRKIINLGYRFIRDEIRQVDVSTEWPLGGRWSARARSLYSLRDDENIESYAGIEYNACCWAVRVFARQRLSETRGQVNGIMFELELAGLSKLGSAPQSPLKQSLFFSQEPTRRAGALEP